MTSFFQDFTSLWSSFFKEEQWITTPEQQLQWIWVDTQEIDQNVTQQMNTAKSKFLSIDRQRELITNAPAWSDPEKIISGLVQRWYTLEWLDSTAVAQEQEQPTQENIDKEDPDTTPWFIERWVEAIRTDPIISTAAAAAAKVPEVIWNIAWFAADVSDFLNPLDNIIEAVTWAEEWTTLFDLEWLADQFRADGIDSKEKLQEVLWVDPEAFTTSLWEFWLEVWTLFIPGWQANLATKVPTLASKVPGLVKTLDKLKLVAPRVYNTLKSTLTSIKDPEKLKLLKSSLVWAKEAAKFEVVSEWEITPTWLVIGAVANPFFEKTWAIVKSLIWKDVQWGLASVISPGKKKWVSTKSIKWDLDSIAATIKGRNLRPNTLEELYQGLSKSLDDIYTKGIKPRLEAIWDATINMNTIVDDVFKKLSTSGKIAWVDISKLSGKWKELEQLKPLLEKWKTGKTDILEVEKLKQLTSALVRESWAWVKEPLLNSVQVEFMKKLNTSLQNNIDDLLKKAGGEWVKALKTEYWAIARQLPALDAKILRELKKDGVSLFEGLWIISGIKDIVSGNIRAWTSSIITWKILNLLKDPDEILQRVVRQIHDSWVKSTITPKVIWVWAWTTSEFLDER